MLGGRDLLPEDSCTNTGQLVLDVLQETRPNMRVPPMEDPTCATFDTYEELLNTVPLDFLEDMGCAQVLHNHRGAGNWGY